MDEIHMRQDAFLPVEGVGLAPHVPGLQGAPLCSFNLVLHFRQKKKA